ncbi:MAG: NAD(P)H-dependent oxidoreductase [Bacteroidia bacterium]|jgi:chromate reductase|nr:NAD(P)H-dependent oxidoreductase [Bacteroidia bacterium]MCO5253406.1 NAD(P)H-dependent oxidoreductase [Bacteroidota bacterium]MCZ2129862.1 NAD(P)H-dependent oxidoreductase [Bacteroidia bacterium]
MKTIGIFVGSLRKDSLSQKIALNIQTMAPEGYEFKIISIGHLPFYNQDLDTEESVHENFVTFRNIIKQLDGVFFVTPEYNRSIPAVLKNALDVASRPAGQNCWSGKPGAIVSMSIGNIAGFGANHHLRQTLTFLNVYTMQQPEAYLAQISPDLFDANNKLIDTRVNTFLKKVVDAYTVWFEKLTR